jgi:hypothetical protein
MATNRNELEARLDRVNNWVNNCDQKSSILLAIEGVVLTILCTSDYISFIRQQLIFPIYNYYETGNQHHSTIYIGGNVYPYFPLCFLLTSSHQRNNRHQIV